MDYKKLLLDNKEILDADTIYYILNCLRTSKNVGRDSLKEVITNNLDNVEEPDHKAIRRLFDYIIPTTVAEKDIQHAISLYGEDITPEEFKQRVLDESTNNTADIAKFKNGLMSGSGNIRGIYEELPDGKRLIHLSSDELFPNLPDMKEYDVFEHRFEINASAADYATVVIQLFQSFVKDNLPFYMVVNLPNDLKYGICDPIKVYSSTKNLPNVLYEVDRMTKVVGDKLIPPSIMSSNVDDLYGYTSLDNDRRKSPMGMVLDIVEKEIVQTIDDFNQNHPGELEENEDTWKSRVTNLNYIANYHTDIYDQMVVNIMNYVSEIGLDLNNLYVLPKLSKEAEQSRQEEEPQVEEYVEDLPEVEEQVQEVQINAEELDENINKINSLIGKLDEQVNTLEQPTENEEDKIEQEFAVPEEIVSTPVVEPVTTIVPAEPVVTSVEPVVPSTPVETQVQPVKSAEEERLDQMLASVTNPVDLVQSAPVVEQPVIEQPVVPTETEVNTIIDNSATNISSEVNDIMNEEAVEEDEPVSFNTGAYSTVPVEVQSLDSDEIKSVIEEPQQVSNEEIINKLGEYAGIVDPSDALLEVAVDNKGTKLPLIDYMKQERVSERIPFDAIITNPDTLKMTGKEFIRQVVVPLFKMNVEKQEYDMDTIIERYTTSIDMENETQEKKESFLQKLFKKR